MKYILGILLILSSFSISAEVEMVCASYNYTKVKKIVETHGDHDKYKHCAVSCLLTLRCTPAEVMQLGILKEGIDLVGPGNAEMDDLKADFFGVNIAAKKKAKTDTECIEQCSKAFIPPSPSC